MTAAKKCSTSSTDILEYMASLKNFNDIVYIDSDSSDEVQIVSERELTNHRCGLCCEGEFLIDKLLRYGQLIDKKYKFVCETCDKNFVYKSELSTHRTRCTGPVYEKGKEVSVVAEKTSNIIKCKSCTKTFKTERGHKKHVTSQHTGLTHTCEICKKVFTSFEKFTQHHLKHSLERPTYLCNFCDQRFNSETVLNKHYMTLHKIGKFVFQKASSQQACNSAN